ncbi:putative Peptidoglycan domain protein [Caballeronia peredens]|nr:putative Peptidoglycan domain protein [Caballeronia peredens]
MSSFDDAFAALLGNEGGFTADAKDRGNWTSGQVGVGQLKGTKYGISAMSYPDLDIKNLTLDAAKQIYKRDYWNPFGGDLLAPALAFQVFDGAVNSGVVQSIKWLQQAVHVSADGVLGPVTKAAVDNHPSATVVAAYNGYRLKFMVSAKTWSTYSSGWAIRIADNLIRSAA